MDIKNPNATVNKMAPSAEAIEALRASRITFSGKEKKLDVHTTRLEEAGWHVHWFNDTNGRVERAMQAGYAHVSREEVALNPGLTPTNNDPGNNVRVAVGSDGNGEPLYAYLMKLPKELWDEDQARAQEQVDLIDAAIQGGVSDIAFSEDPAAKATAYARKDLIKRSTSLSKPVTS